MVQNGHQEDGVVGTEVGTEVEAGATAGDAAALPGLDVREAETWKPAYAFWLIVIGISSVTVIFVTTMIVFQGQFEQATEVLTGLASVFGVIGTLIGAYFGVKASGDAREAAESARRRSSAVTSKVLARSQPEVAEAALKEATEEQGR